jgi:hypothetical protein
MRAIATHRAESNLRMNDLVVQVIDEPGPGGANCVYVIGGFDLKFNQATDVLQDEPPRFALSIVFQNGPAGVEANGVSPEALLAVIIDRLAQFANGPFPTLDNDVALMHCRAALKALHNFSAQKMMVK